MGARALQRWSGSCHCQRVRFRIETDFRELTTCDFVGVNVFCLEGFDPSGIPVRATVGAGMA